MSIFRGRITVNSTEVDFKSYPISARKPSRFRSPRVDHSLNRHATVLLFLRLSHTLQCWYKGRFNLARKNKAKEILAQAVTSTCWPAITLAGDFGTSTHSLSTQIWMPLAEFRRPLFPSASSTDGGSWGFSRRTCGLMRASSNAYADRAIFPLISISERPTDAHHRSSFESFVIFHASSNMSKEVCMEVKSRRWSAPDDFKFTSAKGENLYLSALTEEPWKVNS